MSNLDSILSFLRGKGFSSAQAAGIAGNMQVESGLNPAAYNPREGAIGLVQWEGPRRPALQRFAASRGTTETDLITQLEFMWSELNGSESGAYSALKATTTPADAAAVFDQRYERSAGTSRAQRIAAAQTIAAGGAAFAGTSTSGSTTTTSGGGGESLLDKLNPFDNWAADAMGLGVKLLAFGTAAALVIVGAKTTMTNGANT